MGGYWILTSLWIQRSIITIQTQWYRAIISNFLLFLGNAVNASFIIPRSFFIQSTTTFHSKVFWGFRILKSTNFVWNINWCNLLFNKLLTIMQPKAHIYLHPHPEKWLCRRFKNHEVSLTKKNRDHLPTKTVTALAYEDFIYIFGGCLFVF